MVCGATTSAERPRTTRSASTAEINPSRAATSFGYARRRPAAHSGARRLAREFVGWHDGYSRLADPVIHRRRILLEKRPRRIEIPDRLSMKGAHLVEIFFHCSELCEVKPRGQAVDLRHASLPYPVRSASASTGCRSRDPARRRRADLRLEVTHVRREGARLDPRLARTRVGQHRPRQRLRANPHGSIGVAGGTGCLSAPSIDRAR